VEDNEKQSRESQTQILALSKDIEHFKYVITELENDIEFTKKHFSNKNSERIEDIEKIHKRMDKHIHTELNYHQSVRDKATESHNSIHKRIAHVERWIWIFFGGFTVIGALLGKASFTAFLN
tara:strand:+ start:506 stop:871 length:366 start_codon:yes stop_codon:yes gene_type:complete